MPSHYTSTIYSDIGALPDPTYFDGQNIRLYSPQPSGQMYTAFSNGQAWIASSPVHVGVWANLPAANLVLPGGEAFITDQLNAHYVSTGSQWLNITTTGQTIAISRGYAYT